MNARTRASQRGLGRTISSLTLVACGLITASASATPIINGASYSYTTSGTVGTATGGIPISFIGNDGGLPLLAPGSFSLGSFSVTAPPSGQSDFTATDLPFTVLVTILGNGPAADLGPATVKIQGVINGILTGTQSSDLTATVTSVTGSGPVPFGLDAFQVLAPQILAPSGLSGGSSPLNAYLSVLPQPPAIPEPSTLALFGAVIAFASWRRLRRPAA